MIFVPVTEGIEQPAPEIRTKEFAKPHDPESIYQPLPHYYPTFVTIFPDPVGIK